MTATVKPATTLSTKAVAEALGTDPKTLRRFLRSSTSMVGRVGQGSRYTFTKTEVTALKKRFAAWSKAQPAKKVAPVVTKAPTAKAPKARKAKPVADTTARIDALESSLKARGTHISQN